jgi:chitodextrinase
MKKLICTVLLFINALGIAQIKNDLWKKDNSNEASKKITKSHLPQKNIFELDITALNKILSKTSKNQKINTQSNILITLPNGEGKFENFLVYENSIMSPELALKYPEIKSYIGIGTNNTKATAYFSSTPLGFKSMTVYPDKETIFIESINSDNTSYTVYKKSDRKNAFSKFECGVTDTDMEVINQSANTLLRGADDGKLRTFRLAVSCTGEYANYFGGTKALALAGIVNTMTRVNGIFERDFGLRLILISNNDDIIYTDSASDPYTDSSTYWGSQLQSNLTNVIGEANYDIGHLFGGTTAGGNANCKGCICVDGIKGSGYTGTSTPSGDNFDIDYVAHEMGHQLGANHTFTYRNEGGNPAQMEPGSASTIMSYAGTSLKDIVQKPDAYFHAISIQQVTDNIKTKTCATITLTGNATPVVNAGLDYTIPKGTPFMLNGSATDTNTNDILTYSWEQMDLGNATTTVPSSTAATGSLFRSYAPSSSPIRYFPNLNTILSGLTTTQGYRIASETLPGVARTMNFRLTVRDNRAGGGANNSDDMIVTVNDAAGPFTINSQNTSVSYAAGTTQTVNWTVAGTNENGINCSNVDILLSTDGGQTFPIVLLAGTPNDGSQNITIPNISGTSNRLMIKGSNHIFFDINNSNFTITGSGNVDIISPTTSTLSASGTTTTNTNLSWTASSDNVGVIGYDVYQNGVLRTTVNATSLTITGLVPATTYNFYIKAKDDAGNVSSESNTVIVTTLAPIDTTAPTASILSASGTATTNINLSWTPSSDNVEVIGYDVYQNGVLRTTVNTTSLTITGLMPATTYNFYIKAKDAAGNASPNSNTINVTTLSIGVSYCNSNGSTAKEYINIVEIGDINNRSGDNNGYANFTMYSTTAALNDVVSISITPSWNGKPENEACNVWIDFNQNGNFESNELVLSEVTTKKSKSFIGSFVIPSNAVLGSTRMRISMKNNNFPTACEIYSGGEVEDYTINIISATVKNTKEIVNIKEEQQEVTKLDFKLYPNPVKGDLLYFSEIENNTSYRIYNQMGQEVSKGFTDNNSINVGILTPAIYIIEMTDDKSVGIKRFIKE